MTEAKQATEIGSSEKTSVKEHGYEVQRTESGEGLIITLPGNQQEGTADYVLLDKGSNGSVTAFRMRGREEQPEVINSGGRRVVGALLQEVFEAGRKSSK